MMHPMVRAAVAGVGLLASSLVCRAEVSIRQADDKSVAVTTGVYTAKIDSKGNLAELAVKGAKAFTHTFGDPGKPPAVMIDFTLASSVHSKL